MKAFKIDHNTIRSILYKYIQHVIGLKENMTINQFNQLKIAFITIYEQDLLGNWCLPESLVEFLKVFEENDHDLYCFDLHHYKYSSQTVEGLSLRKESLVTIYLKDLDCLHFCWSGKNISYLDKNSCLNDQIEPFCHLIEMLESFGKNSPIVVNSLDCLMNNITKNYYFTFNKKINFIPSIVANNVEDLLQRSKEKQRYIAKPFISERSKGATILNDMSPAEIELYFRKFNNQIKNPKNLYEKILSQQKILIQPYHESFIKNGEIKACLVDGEFFLARKVLPKGDVAILDFHSGEAYHAYYQPTEEEIDFYKNVFKIFYKKYPISYMRLDCISTKEGTFVNEIEAINPGWRVHGSLKGINNEDLKFKSHKFHKALYLSMIEKIKEKKEAF